MKCIFCLQDSSNSKSVEHVIPESLGNSLHHLPPGIVCDKCNNYFSHSVEKPFLNLEEIRFFRTFLQVYSKKGKLPPYAEQSGNGIIVFNSERKAGRIIIPAAKSDIPDSGPVVSRFLAKVAFEVMASKLLASQQNPHELVNNSDLQLIREHARYGTNASWPYLKRRIYPFNKIWHESDGIDYLNLHEYVFFEPEAGYFYFLLVLFGIEFSINIGYPGTKEYEIWLQNHKNQSPLLYN